MASATLRLARICRDLGFIFSENRTIKKPWTLFFDYLRFRIKGHFRPAAQSESFLGYKICFPHFSLFYNLWFEIFVQEIYSVPISNSAPHIVDAGSNIGLSILFFKYMYPNARITGLEASSSIFGWLEGNIRENGLDKDVQIFNVAVTGRSETIAFFESDYGASSSVFPRFLGETSNQRVAEIEGKPLSGFLKDPVDILKIDIEGSELDALKEAGKNLDNVKFVVLEMHRNKDFCGILKILDDNGFRYILISSSPLTPLLRQDHEFFSLVTLTAAKRTW